MTSDELKLHRRRMRPRARRKPKFYVNEVTWTHPIELLVINRPNDEYFVDMINDIMQKAMSQNIEFSAYYQSIGIPGKEITNTWTGKNHILFQCDNAVMNSGEFIDFVRAHPEMKILVFGCQLLPQDARGLENLRIIKWGGDYLIEKDHYQQIDPVKKFFLQDYHWISLSNHPRLHRWMAALYIKGLGLDKTGMLSISKKPITFGMVPMYDPNEGIEHSSWRDFCQNQWALTSGDDAIYGKIFDIGSERIKIHNINSPERPEIYTTSYGNAENLDRRLRLLYASSAVEIINETTFDFDMGMHVSEKVINSVYGMNLPIILGQCGVVEYCRKLGFDMFDDVVDHSYDVISRPIDRLTAAIDRNRRLLEDRDFAIAAWHQCQPRLQANYELARYRLHDQVYNRVMSEVPAALDFLS